MADQGKFEAAIIGALLGAIIGWSYFSKDEPDIERQEYCENVEIFKQTNGDSGWPEYDGPCSEEEIKAYKDRVYNQKLEE